MHNILSKIYSDSYSQGAAAMRPLATRGTCYDNCRCQCYVVRDDDAGFMAASWRGMWSGACRGQSRRLAGLATCEATFRVQVLQLAVLGPTNGVARIDDDANSFRGQLIIARAWATTNVGQVPPRTSLIPGHLLHPENCHSGHLFPGPNSNFSLILTIT